MKSLKLKGQRSKVALVLGGGAILFVAFSFQFLLSNIRFAHAQDVNPPASAPVNTLRPAPNNALPSQNPALNIPDPELNPNEKGFKIVVCDGPTLPPDVKAKLPNGGAGYVPCDFNGVMRQVQHIINIMMVLGVLVSILMFSYAGFLYITGKQDNIKKATSMFPKIFFGFIIMLSAWFIVYQILSWLTNVPGFKALLGSP